MFQAYEILSEEMIEDVHAKGTLLRHKKSGARIALLSNQDDNKVFNIAFRTPPENSTGVAHIIEHTVLCGSRKFPLKDPFVELAKGSLNTFLNAMTYPDKTMFPVASCNDTDFQNLVDVYLDAVFYPNIYKEEKIFRQEGWHYELENENENLKYNGVVYNEMKGAFSSSEEVLERTVFNALFPDNAYGVESGGDPKHIPELTYEEFLNFHRRYYHPSNSYIYFYGNMNMEEKLDWLDREYLSKFDAIEVPSEINMQEPFDEPREITAEYPILEDEPLENNSYISQSMVVSDSGDVLKNMAFSVLEYVLLSSPGAPVKQALLDAGIGDDVDGSFNDGILQPFFSIDTKNADPKDKDRFVQIIHDTLEELSRKGLNRKAILAGINYFEFRFREADFSSYPKGLIYGIDMFDGWLYDEMAPFAYLKEIEVFESLKKKTDEGYFEQLIRDHLLSNPHSAVVVLNPKRGLTQAEDEQTAKKLAAYKAGLSSEEIRKIVEDTKLLKEYQDAPETGEALASLPVLKRTDIQRKTPITLKREEHDCGGTTVLHMPYDTNGIGYLTIAFDAQDVPDELVPYLGILRSVLGYVSTENYSYNQLFHEINANCGGISWGLQTYPVESGENKCYRQFGVQAKYLYGKQDFVFDMIKEIILTSDLADAKRLKEILASQKSRLQNALTQAGHGTAMRRALSYISYMAAWQDRTAGISYYHFLEELVNHFDERKSELTENLHRVMECLLRPEKMFVGITCEKDAGKTVLEPLYDRIADLRSVLYTGQAQTGEFHWERNAANEGWKTSGQVQYVASVGNYREKGFAYHGALRILKVILNYDYLWMNIRVKGGAYGCMAAFARNGESYMVSYRDPHLKRTLDVYRGLPEYLRNFEADELQLTKYIIGTISELDTPLNAAAMGGLAFASYFTGVTEEVFQKEREQILDATAEDIRALADLTGCVADTENICVVGSESVLEKDADELKTLRPFVNGR